MKKATRGSISRPILIVSLFLGAIGLGAVLYFSLYSGPRKPSFLFILIDTLRSDHLSCFGYPRATSPHLDRLAAEGVRFDCARSQASWTLPSMISLMSGRYIFTDIPALPRETPNLPLLLRQLGYNTAGFIANSLVGEKEGFDKGFDHFEIREHKTPQWTAKDLNSRLLPWMHDHLKPPFFLYLHYLDPHHPYTPPKDMVEFESDYDPITQERRNRYDRWLKDYPELYQNAHKDIEEMRYHITLYDGEIRLVDQCVGEVVNALKELGFDEETVIVVTADHGEGLWEHPHYLKAVEKQTPRDQWSLTTCFFRDHGYHLYEELIRVPMIINGPGIEPGKVVYEAVENVDLVPTLLEMAGDPQPFPGDGRSLVPTLAPQGPSLGERAVLFSHCNEGSCIIEPEKNLKLI
ncbi:MAG: sulfatase, partial [Planctomycetes bacterium]|nr:sulfatase [Planctomycetota bacterium]